MTDFQPFNTTADWQARGYRLRTPPLILVGYDTSGDGDDKDALTMVAREEHQHGEPWDPDFAVMTMYRVLMAHRMAPQLEFPDKLAMLMRLHRQLNGWVNVGRSSGHVFTVETNGVGWAMSSSLRQKIGNKVVPYTTVGKLSEDRYVERKTSMPRLAALDNLRVLAETHCLKVAKGAPGAKDLAQEMGAFVWRAPGRPEALQGQHDDLVMSVCGAVWIGSKVIPPLLKQASYRERRAS